MPSLPLWSGYRLGKSVACLKMVGNIYNFCHLLFFVCSIDP